MIYEIDASSVSKEAIGELFSVLLTKNVYKKSY